MGDVGSTFLGAMLFGIIINSKNLDEAFFILLPSIPLFADTFFTVLRRFFARENIFEAHSLHLFQRLYRAGWTHSKICLLYISATLFIGIFSLFRSWNYGISSIFFVFLIGFYLDQNVALPFKEQLKKNY